MRNLFLRLLVSLWAAMTLIVGLWALIHAWAVSSDSGPLHQHFNVRAVELRAELALLCQRQGLDECEKSLERRDRRDDRIALYQNGTRIVGEDVEGAAALITAAQESPERVVEEVGDRQTVAVVLDRDPSIVAVSTGPVRSAWTFFIVPETLPYRLLAIAAVTGLVSVLLARTLSRPLRTIRQATREIASGDLSVRVAPRLRGADEESHALGRDLDRMAERIEALLEAQRRLLRDVSHELRSPLARLGIALELVRRKATPDTAPQFERIERETQRLNEMIGELLTLSRLEANDRVTQPAELDLGALLKEIVDDVGFEAEAAGSRVTLASPERIAVMGDAELLHRAIENVVRNSTRFTEPGTSVDVDVKLGPTDVTVEVRDHGPGVPEETLVDIFKPFYRVDTDRARSKGGTGIGLAITERAVALHGGRVSARNAEGGGLAVSLVLPRRTD